MKKQKLGQLFLATWAILSIGSLAGFLYEYAGLAATGNADSFAQGELEFGLAFTLYIVNFPSSVALQYLVLILVPDESALATWCGHPAVLWCLLTWVGFVQWAFITPAIGRWLKDLWLTKIRTVLKASPRPPEKET